MPFLNEPLGHWYIVSRVNVTDANYENIRATLRLCIWKLIGWKDTFDVLLWTWGWRMCVWEKESRDRERERVCSFTAHPWIKICLECSSCCSHALLSDWFVALSNYKPFEHHCLHFDWVAFDLITGCGPAEGCVGKMEEILVCFHDLSKSYLCRRGAVKNAMDFQRTDPQNDIQYGSFNED